MVNGRVSKNNKPIKIIQIKTKCTQILMKKNIRQRGQCGFITGSYPIITSINAVSDSYKIKYFSLDLTGLSLGQPLQKIYTIQNLLSAVDKVGGTNL
jgi:hypothetical protein